MSRKDEFNPYRGNPLTHLLWKETNEIGCYVCRRNVYDKQMRKWKCSLGIKGHPYLVAGAGVGECTEWEERERVLTKEDAEKLFK